MADRDVVFTGKFETSPEARKNFEEMGKLAADAQKAIDQAASASNKAITETATKAADAQKKLSVDFSKLSQANVDQTKAITAAASKAAEIQKKIAGDFGKLSQANVDRAKSEELAAKIRVDNARREAQQQATNIRRIYDQATKEVQRQQQVIAQANVQISDGLTKAGEGAVKFGRGLALVGLAGEKDMQKILEVLIKVQAVVDLTRGGIEIYRGISEAVKAYRTAVIAATAAETALASARARTAAAGASMSVGGVVPQGVAAGLPGAAGLGAGSMAAAAIAAPAAVLAAGAMALNVGGSRDYVANSEFMQRNTVPGSIGGNAARLADVTSGQGGLGWFDPRNSFDTGRQFRIAREFFGTKNTKGDSLAARQNRAVKGEKLATAAERQREIRQANQARDLEQRDQQFSIQQQLRSARSVQTRQSALAQGRADGLTGLDLQRFALGRQQDVARGQVDIDAGNLAQARNANQGTVLQRQAQGQANANLNQSLQEAIELTRQRLEVEKAIAAEQKQATDAQIRGIQDAIALEEQKLRAAQDAIASGEERLGRASEQERRQFTEASRKVLGGQQVTQEELEIAERYGGEEVRARVSEEFRRRGRGAAQASGAFAFEEQQAQRARDDQRRQQGFAAELEAQREEEEANAQRNINRQQNDLDNLTEQQARNDVQTVVDRQIDIRVDDGGVIERGVAQLNAVLDRRDKQIAAGLKQEFEAELARRDADRRAGNAGLN